MVADNQERDRKGLTFSQADGLEPIPEPLKLGELSQEARNLIWREFLESIGEAAVRSEFASAKLDSRWDKILYDWHVEVLHKPADEFSSDLSGARRIVKADIYGAKWNKVFDFLEFVMRRPTCPHRFSNRINWFLRKSRAAYLVVPDPPTIMPRATEQEGDAIVEALTTLDSAGLGGARAHLLQAGERLNAGDYADAVRESVHAVESVARKLDPKASDNLAPALKALQQHTAVHPALKEGFSRIYGYTSDKGGIRHALLEDEAQVDLEDAVFMIGACASFTSYLVGKARKAGLIAK